MISNTVTEVLGFDDADLAANRLNQLTQKQENILAEKAKSHKGFNTIIGVIIAVVFGGALLTGLGAPIFATLGGSLLESGKVTPEALLTLIPIICGGLFFLVILVSFWSSFCGLSLNAPIAK